ncbi:hypothetical protein XANCAGTX0491_002089 [Xanthoria calcicola]
MAKRKIQVELKAQCLPRKRFAFSAPKTAATKSIIRRNASQSPLLKLPLEIRNQIWIEVLGHQLVHLFQPFDTYSDDGTDSDDSDDNRTRESTGRPQIPWNEQSGQLSHKICQRNGQRTK